MYYLKLIAGTLLGFVTWTVFVFNASRNAFAKLFDF
jgi:hypothetical protein